MPAARDCQLTHASTPVPRVQAEWRRRACEGRESRRMDWMRHQGGLTIWTRVWGSLGVVHWGETKRRKDVVRCGRAFRLSGRWVA